jgi:hypothetical protein
MASSGSTSSSDLEQLFAAMIATHRAVRFLHVFVAAAKVGDDEAVVWLDTNDHLFEPAPLVGDFYVCVRLFIHGHLETSFCF